MRIVSLVLALTLSASAAMAGELSPLTPGTPAGLKRAQTTGQTMFYAALAAGVLTVIAVAASGDDAAPAVVAAPATTTSTA